MVRRSVVVTIAYLLLPMMLLAQGGQIAIRSSAQPTYHVSAGGLVTTAAYSLSIESAATGTGFRLLGWCAGLSNATAAALVTITVQRRTTASTGGTACTAEGTSADCAITKMDPGDANYGGVARSTGTLGTGGAVLDQVGQTIGEIAAGGTADTPGPAPVCVSYDQDSGKMPIVASGVANGLSILVSAPGAGGLAAGSISARIVAP